ncbi:MAG: hypothetical protein U5K69_28230 [Balneolaceae bacterium]|nr:hypothetical protein [Balneolaceae bacterium]
MDLAITIRTAAVENGRLTVRAGRRNRRRSDPETERIETVNKAKAIIKAMRLLKSASGLRIGPWTCPGMGPKNVK